MYEVSDLIVTGVICGFLGMGIGMVLERWHWHRIVREEKK